MFASESFEVGVLKTFQQTSHRPLRFGDQSTCPHFAVFLRLALSPLLPSRRRAASESARHGEAAAGGDRHLREHHRGRRGRRRPQARGTAKAPSLPLPLFDSGAGISRDRPAHGGFGRIGSGAFNYVFGGWGAGKIGVCL